MVRGVVVPLALVAVLISCSPDPADEQLDLGADGHEETAPTTEPIEPDGAAAEGTDGEGDEVHPSLGPPTFPELPLEPDPSSDVSVEDQELGFSLHERLYEVTQTALHTGEFDEDELAEVMTGELLDETLESFHQRREDGIVSRSLDTEIRWVAVIDAERTITVQDCRVGGPETATYHLDTGEVVGERPQDGSGAIFEVVYEPMLIDDAPGFRAVELTVFADQERCGG